MRIIELLNWSTNHLKNQGVDNPRLEAEILLAHCLRINREKLYINLNEFVHEDDQERFNKLLERRMKGEPIQYILGYKEFWSLGLKVNHNVFIPRPETEILVEQALLILQKERDQKEFLILEIGTGSGAIAISIAKELKQVSFIATDISFEAILLAKENAVLAGVDQKIRFINCDLMGPFRFINGGYFDMIISNPPYIKSSDIERLPREVKDYEPIWALDGGVDGMDFYRRIIYQTPFYLKRDGWLLLEVGQGQGEVISEWMRYNNFFKEFQIIKDYSGIDRVVKIRKH